MFKSRAEDSGKSPDQLLKIFEKDRIASLRISKNVLVAS